MDFGRPIGNEQGAGSRPAVVISSEGFNKVGAGLAVVAPLTRSQQEYPSRVRVRPGRSGLRDTSWAAVEHLRSISTLRLQGYLGDVDTKVLEDIDEVLTFLLSGRPSRAS